MGHNRLTITTEIGLPLFASATSRRRCTDPEQSVYLLMMTNGELMAFNRHYAPLGPVSTEFPEESWKVLRRHGGVVQRDKEYELHGRHGEAIWFDLAERPKRRRRARRRA
jgi:hypothetical protein